MAVNRLFGSNARNIYNEVPGDNSIEAPIGAAAGDILIYDGTNWVPSGTTGQGRIGTIQATNVNNNAGGPLNVGTTDNQDVNFFRNSVLQFLLSAAGVEFGVPISNTAGTDLTFLRNGITQLIMSALGAEFSVPVTNAPGSDLTVGTSDNQDLEIIRNTITQMLFTATGIELGVPLTNTAGTPISFGTSDNQPVTITQNGTTAMFVDSTGVNVSTNLTLAIGGYHNLYTVRLGIFEYDNTVGAVFTVPDSNWTAIPLDNIGSTNNSYLAFPFDTYYDIESLITFDGIAAPFDIVARGMRTGVEYSRTYFATVTGDAEQIMSCRFVFTVPSTSISETLEIQVWQNSGAALNVRFHQLRSAGLY